MMDCNFIDDKLYDYLNNEHDEVTKKSIETHLLSCESCKKEMEILLSIKSSFKNTIQSPSPSLLQKIKKATKTANWLDYIMLHKKIFAFSITCAFLIIGILFFNILLNKNKNDIDEFLYNTYNASMEETNSNTFLTLLNID